MIYKKPTLGKTILKNVNYTGSTVRPLFSAELDYPRFLRSNPSTPNLYVAKGAVSKAVEVVPIPLHPIIQFSFIFIVY